MPGKGNVKMDANRRFGDRGGLRGGDAALGGAAGVGGQAGRAQNFCVLL